MKKLLVICLLALCTGVSYAVSFTADAVQIRGENIVNARIYWLDGNVRFEYMEDGVSMAQIFDNKNSRIIWLDNENKYYLEKEMAENQKILNGGKSDKLDDPCNQFVDAECVFLKKTRINGREAEKWLITLDYNGNDYHIFQWIDIQYRDILRQENSDGSGISVQLEDNQEINGRKVRKLTMLAFSASGEQQQGIQWYDNELDVVIKQHYQGDIIDELRNIKVGKVDKKLFAIPDDYRIFDASLQAAGEQQSVVDK